MLRHVKIFVDVDVVVVLHAHLGRKRHGEILFVIREHGDAAVVVARRKRHGKGYAFGSVFAGCCCGGRWDSSSYYRKSGNYEIE